MSDIQEKERDREWREWEKLDDKTFRQDWSDKQVAAELKRIEKDGMENPEKGSSAKEQLTRLERIREGDAMRHMPDYDVERAREMENLEIRTNPEGFVRRHQGEKLDPATEREIRKALDRKTG